MQKCVLLLLAIGVVIVSSAAAEEKAAVAVPLSFQGDWLIPSRPSPHSLPGQRFPDLSAITLRISASNYLVRLHKDAGLTGGWDESGESMKFVKDEDGKEYLEARPFSVAIRTDPNPWQIDLWRKAADGTLLEKKGICSLEGDTLTLSIGYTGKPRPTSFDDPGIGGSYSFMKATRIATASTVGSPKPALEQKTKQESGAGGQSPGKARKPVSDETKEPRIVEYGEYSTLDAQDTIDPKWTLAAETTKVKIKSNSGFGMRFYLPGPYAEDRLIVSVTIVGGLGPPGVVGYEFKRGCPVANGKCIGDLIIPCGGMSPPRPGDCKIIIVYRKWTLEKTFQLSD